MATVAFLVNPARIEARRLLADTVPWLAAQGHQVHLLQLSESDDASGDVPAGDSSGADLSGADLSGTDLSGADLAVSLGGDGTFLRLVPLAYAARIPVLGVNFGRLGYLLEVEPDHFQEALGRALVGDVEVEERTMLAVSVRGALTATAGDDRSIAKDGGTGPSDGRWWVALNEAVVEKTVPGHMVNLSMDIDGAACMTYQADGVLVATPTGSTAYSLSAGGPVMSPRLQAMIVTPIAPHLSIDRSLVLHPDQVVTVRVLGDRPAVLVVDGREVGRLHNAAEVTCRVAPDSLHVISLGERGFAGILRSTLAPTWGGTKPGLGRPGGETGTARVGLGPHTREEPGLGRPGGETGTARVGLGPHTREEPGLGRPGGETSTAC